MDILSARQMLRTRTIYEIPMRVTFYARVSSDSDEQLNSLANQRSYYENLIRKNPAWTFVEGYVDEGLSGISTRKREDFHRMIQDGKDGRFDMIITKNVLPIRTREHSLVVDKRFIGRRRMPVHYRMRLAL